MGSVALANACRCLLVLAGSVAWLGIPACGDYHTRSTPTAGPDAGLCSLPSTLSPNESAGSGIINGMGVSASVCNVGVMLFSSSDSSPPDQLLMRLNWDVTARFDFQNPSAATGGMLSGLISVRAPVPGRYTSACGVLSFGYRVPAAQDPLVLGFDYQATAALGGCSGGGPPSVGSWTVALTSVSEVHSDTKSDSTVYLAHGQITASLVGVGPTDTVTLALAF